MNKITLITAASALMLASGAWANGAPPVEHPSDNSAMNCGGAMYGLNPGQNMQAHHLAGKDKGEENPAQHTNNMLGEMIQMMCENPSPKHSGPPSAH